MNANEWQSRAQTWIERATLAPSSHNTQPWIFSVSSSAIELHADRTRALPVNDPHDRELVISCACALMNLRIAAVNDGFGVRATLLPELTDADRLASVRVLERSDAPSDLAGLAQFIEQRRTYRKRFDAREVSAAIIEQLMQAANLEGAWFRPLWTEESRQEAASLVAEGDAAQWANPSWRRELAAWMHPRRRGDGLTMPALSVPVAQVVVRTFDMGGGVGAKDRDLATASPLLGVLGTDGDQPQHWLQAGQALQRVLLLACRHGLQASYLNQPIQIAGLRARMQDLVGGGMPQVLLRMGYPDEAIDPAPRRAVEDVID